MKKILALMLALMFVALPALAAGQPYVASTLSGAVLVGDDGTLITQMGAYDVIDLISYEDCPSERQLFMVSRLDMLGDMFDDDEFEEWDEALDEVENWPDTEGLDEGYDMEIVDDMPIDAEFEDDEEFGDMFGDDGFYDDYEDDFDELDMPDYGVALMNARGELLTGFEYVSLQHDVNNGVVAAYTFEGFVTMLDEAGNVLLKGEYTSVVSDGQGGYMAIKPVIDGETGDFSDVAPIVHIAADGSESQTGFHIFSYDALPNFSEGLMCVAVVPADATLNDDEKYIYIDAQGNDVFGKQFTYASSFYMGCAEVSDSDLTARLIDKSGENITSENYAYFDIGGADLPIIGNLVDGGFDLISKTEHTVIASHRPEAGTYAMSAYHSGSGLIMANTENENLILDGNGNILYRSDADVYADIWYEFADAQPQRLVMTYLDGDIATSCVAGMDGQAVSGWYDSLTAMSWQNGEGRYLAFDCEFDEVDYGEFISYEPIMESCRYGMIDQDGNVIIPIEYDYITCLSPDRFWAEKGSECILFDAAGNAVATFQGE